MKKTQGRTGFHAMGLAAALTGAIVLLGGCKDSTGFWRSLDGGAAPTADYRPSRSTPDATTTTTESQTASQTAEPTAPSEPK